MLGPKGLIWGIRINVGGGGGGGARVLVYVSNLIPLGCFLLVYFGGGSCSSCCDSGKTKSTPSPKAEAWTLDWSLTKIKGTP